jgi:hypothetical protein
VWLSQLGPSAYLVWDRLARRLDAVTLSRPEPGPAPATTRAGVTTGRATVAPGLDLAVAELCGELGLGSPTGNQARIRRALRRLEFFGLLRIIDAGHCLLRTRLPLIPPERVGRLPPSVRAAHDHAQQTARAC